MRNDEFIPEGHPKTKTTAMTLALVALLVLTPFIAMPSVNAAPVINISVDSQVLIAGAENLIIFTVTNSGDSMASNINATVTVPTNNMLLVDSDGRWNLSNLNAGQSSNITVKAYIAPSAAGSLIQLTVRITYLSGTTQTDTKTMGFSVATVDLSGAYLSTHFSTFDLFASQNNSVSLIIENQGGREATNISVSLGMPSGLGSGLSGLESLTSLTGSSSLSSGSTQFLLYNNTGRWNFDSLPVNGTLELPLTLFVMPSAAGSISMFPVTLTYTDGFTYTQVTRYATVRVPAVPSSGINFHVGVAPQEFNSGQVTQAIINVTNMGTEEMNAVSMLLSLSGSSSSGSSVYGGVTIPSGAGSSFVLIGQDGSWFLGDVAAGESRLLPVDVYTSPSASGSLASLSVTLSYTDQMSKAKQETKTIGVIVRGLVDIFVLETSTYPQNITIGKAFSASINIINLGTSTAQGMLVFPVGNDYLTSVSANNVFLGDVEVNVPTSITISYIASNLTSGIYGISIPYTYKDSLGEWLNGTLEVPLKITVSSGNDTQPTDNQQGGVIGILTSYGWILVIAAIVVIVAIFLVMRRRKKRT